MPKTYTHHRLDIYGHELFVTTTKRGWSNIQRLFAFHDVDTTAAGQTHSGQLQPDDGSPNVNAIAIYINANHGNEAEHIDTCAHEAAHAAEAILEGTKIPTGGEPLAYLTGWLTRWLWENTKG